jgi:hypothetical protein
LFFFYSDRRRSRLFSHPCSDEGGGIHRLGALKDIGLPQVDIPLALLSFNLGVKAGQIVFVGAMLLGEKALSALFTAPAQVRCRLSNRDSGDDVADDSGKQLLELKKSHAKVGAGSAFASCRGPIQDAFSRAGARWGYVPSLRTSYLGLSLARTAYKNSRSGACFRRPAYVSEVGGIDRIEARLDLASHARLARITRRGSNLKTQAAVIGLLTCDLAGGKFSRVGLSCSTLTVPIREAIHHTTVKALGHLYWNVVNNMELPKFMQFMEHSQKTM